MAAIGTAHGSASDPAVKRDRGAGEQADRPADDGQHRAGDGPDAAADQHGPGRGMVQPLLAHPLDLLDRVAEQCFDFRSEEHTSELQSLMRISYAVFCLKKKKHNKTHITLHSKTVHNNTTQPLPPPH